MSISLPCFPSIAIWTNGFCNNEVCEFKLLGINQVMIRDTDPLKNESTRLEEQRYST